jgi:hypothetical protein
VLIEQCFESVVSRFAWVITVVAHRGTRPFEGTENS